MQADLDCPDLDSWQALLGDALPGDQRESFEKHLETCHACQDTVHRAADAGENVRKLGRLIGDPTSTPVDPALTGLMERLREGSPARVPLADPADLYFLRPTNRPDILGLLGDYEVQEAIGQGGMGIVLKALDPALHRLTAIKVMNPALAGSDTARRRFTREAQAAAAVSHDNVVAVYGVSEAAGLPYLVMQYIAGESLQERLERTGPMELVDVVRIGLQTASGLAAAHAQGLIHRDIKPANLLLENGIARVKITDFGLARSADDSQLTQQGMVAGTPEYMAPEQACGEAVDHRADLFSLGSVLYAMIAGHPPFQGGTPLAVLRKVIDVTPAPLHLQNPQVPAWLETVVHRLLAKDPAARFQSAAEVAGLLEGYLAHLHQPATVAAPPLPPDRRPRAGFSRGSLLLFLAAILGLAGVIGYVAAGAASDRDEQSRDYYHSFQNNPDSSAGFEPFGPSADSCVKFTPGGLRIAVPPGPKQAGGTGVLTHLALQGDFEIIAGYEIVAEPDLQRAKASVRFTLGLLWDKPAGNYNMATLTRNMGPGLGAHYGTWISLWDEQEGKNRQQFKFFRTQAKKGRLRLVRTGSLLSYYVAEDNSDLFTLLQELPFTRDTVEQIRLTVMSDGNDEPFDARVTDLRVRANAVHAPGTQSIGSKAWLILGLVFLLALALGLGGWFMFGQRRALRETSARKAGMEHSGILQQAAAVAASPVRAGPGVRMAARRGLLVGLLAVAVGLAGAIGLVAAGSGMEHNNEPRREYYHSFKDNPDSNKGFFLFGLDADQRVKFTPEGLLLTQPPGARQNTGTGVVTRMVVQGDFEVTASFEILAEPDVRKSRSGARLNLALVWEKPAGIVNIGSLSRSVGPKVGDHFSSWVSVWDDSAGKSQQNYDVFPARVNKGRLRLARIGSVLSLYTSADNNDTFTLLKEYPFSKDNVEEIRLTVISDETEEPLQARFTDLHVRSDALAPVPSRKNWLLLTLTLLLVLMLSLTGWLMLRQRRVEPQEELHAPDGVEKAEDGATPAAAVLPAEERYGAPHPRGGSRLYLWLPPLACLALLGVALTVSLVQAVAPFHWRIWIAAAIAVFVVASCLSGLLQSRLNRPSDETASTSASQEVEAVPAPAAEPVSFLCTTCGKKLRARGALSGKQVKCPSCGAASMVPNAGLKPLSSPSL